MESARRTVWIVLLSVLVPAPLFGGPDWIERGDAGSFLSTAQVTIKRDNRLLSLSGSLSSSFGLGLSAAADLEDMYIFRITDAANFSVRTITNGGELADFNTQLWLFRLDPPDLANLDMAFGLLASDDAPGHVGLGSEILAVADDATGQTIPGPGLYALAITGFNNDPTSTGGILFDQASTTEVSGPDGPGAASPHSGWTRDPSGDPATGNYLILLENAAPVAIPALSVWGAIALVLTLLVCATLELRRYGAAKSAVA